MEYIVYSKFSHSDEWTETNCYNLDDIIEEFTLKLSLGFTVKLDTDAQDLMNETM